MPVQNRYFGSAEQRGLESRADLLWQLVKGDPSYCFHGRAVGLLKSRTEDVATQIALARLQGLGPSPRLAPEVAMARKTEIEEAGLFVEIQQHWCADDVYVAMARDFERASALPAELRMYKVGRETPATDFDKLEALTQSCGILLPAASFLLGDAGPAVCLIAKTREGEVVGFAAALVQATCAASEQGKAWWGFLSTARNWRQRGVAKVLGAKAIVAMADRYGIHNFDTGILSDNMASIGVSKSLGFRASGLLDLLAIDPEVLSAGKA